MIISNNSREQSYKIKFLKPYKGAIFTTDMEGGLTQTANGIIILDADAPERGDRGIRPRWSRVAFIADDVTDVKVGDWILVEHGRWTTGINLEFENGEKIRVWKIQDAKYIILASSEDLRAYTTFKD